MYGVHCSQNLNRVQPTYDVINLHHIPPPLFKTENLNGDVNVDDESCLLRSRFRRLYHGYNSNQTGPYTATGQTANFSSQVDNGNGYCDTHLTTGNCGASNPFMFNLHQQEPMTYSSLHDNLTPSEEGDVDILDAIFQDNDKKSNDENNRNFFFSFDNSKQKSWSTHASYYNNSERNSSDATFTTSAKHLSSKMTSSSSNNNNNSTYERPLIADDVFTSNVSDFLSHDADGDCSETSQMSSLTKTIKTESCEPSLLGRRLPKSEDKESDNLSALLRQESQETLKDGQKSALTTLPPISLLSGKKKDKNGRSYSCDSLNSSEARSPDAFDNNEMTKISQKGDKETAIGRSNLGCDAEEDVPAINQCMFGQRAHSQHLLEPKHLVRSLSSPRWVNKKICLFTHFCLLKTTLLSSKYFVSLII